MNRWYSRYATALSLLLGAYLGNLAAQGVSSSAIGLQQGGTPKGAFVVMNCSTNMTCSVSGGIATITSTGGGGGSAGVSSGPFASVPACGMTGYVYVATDSGVNGYCNGSSSLVWKYGPLIVAPVTTADTAWFGQNGATIAADTATEGILLTSTQSNANNVQARIKATASTPYTQIGCFNLYNGQAFSNAGLIWTDGTNATTSNLITFGPVFNGTALTMMPGLQLQVNKATGTVGATTGYSTVTVPNSESVNALCLGLSDDGTNRSYAYSYDKQNWYVLLTTTRTDFLTPTEMGYYVNSAASNQIIEMHLFSWETVASALF